MSESLSLFSLPNYLTRSSLGHTRHIRKKPEYNSQRLLNDPGTQTFCAPLPSFQQFAQLRSSAGFYNSNIFTVLKKSPQKDLGKHVRALPAGDRRPRLPARDQQVQLLRHLVELVGINFVTKS